jgi:hypothetical protein
MALMELQHSLANSEGYLPGKTAAVVQTPAAVNTHQSLNNLAVPSLNRLSSYLLIRVLSSEIQPRIPVKAICFMLDSCLA